jgi:integrase
MARLGRAIASDPDGKVFLVIALTGARVSEITRLKWSYLDLDNGGGATSRQQDGR